MNPEALASPSLTVRCEETTSASDVKKGCPDPSWRKTHSPLYYISVLAICTTFVELTDGLVTHFMDPYLSHNGRILFDILFMVCAITPTFYFLVYRPMKHYARQSQAAEGEVRFLSRQLLHTIDHENRTVARELYDQLGHSLAMMQFSMGTLKASIDQRQLGQLEQCDKVIDSITRIGSMVRRRSSRLCPPQLEDLGLVPTLEGAVKEVAARDGRFRINLSSRELSGRLPIDLEQALYAIYTVAMDNVIRHSGAQNVLVTLSASAAQACLEIEDDGQGFDPGALRDLPSRQGIGLLVARERLESLGGKLRLDTAPGKGTRLAACLPLSLRRKTDHGQR